MPETICPFCKKNWPQDFRWCMEDGSELEEDKGQYVEELGGMPGIECPECGAKVDPRDEFCAGCGTRLQSAEAARALSSELSCSKCGALVNPNDDFCGGCGAGINTIAGQAADAPQQIAAPSAGACPNCGMEITPGEAFCGTCGHSVSSAAPAPAQSSGYTAAAAPVSCPSCGMGVALGEMFCGTCGFNMSASVAPPAPQASVPQAGNGCPNCGMEVTPGETFCGTCGHNLQGAAAPVAQSYDPASAGVACPNCGLEVAPAEAFCGSCGFNMSQASAPAAPAYQAPAAAAPSGLGCPNCGMEVAPGETFCGTCGHNLQGAAAPVAQSYETPASAGVACPNCELEVDPAETFCGSCGFNMSQASAPAAPAYQAPVSSAPSGAGCPSCGMAVDPGEPFCGTCGFNLQAASAPAPAPAPDQQIYAAGEVSSPSVSCPNCGMEITPGEPFCGTCGHNLNETAAPGASSHTEDAYAAPTAHPAPVSASGEACPSCGMEINPGEPFCGTCGFSLSATPEPSIPQSFDSPSAMPPGSGCPNCGMENVPGETYCGTCGFDLQGGAPAAAAPATATTSAPAFDSAPAVDYQPFSDGPIPNTAVAPAHGSQCPICGTNVYEGETTCGNCGYAMGDQSAYDLSQPIQPPHAEETSADPYAGFIHLKKKSYFTCKKCGSSNAAPGGMYCADCGAMVGDDDDIAAETEAAEPIDQPPLRSLSDYADYEKVCPECNIVAAPGSDTCLVCGMKIASGETESPVAAMAPQPPSFSDEEMIPQPPPVLRTKPSAPLADFSSDEPVWAAPVSDQFAATSAADFQPISQDFVPPPQEATWAEAPAWGAAPAPSSGAPICVECGATASSSDALCPACGGLLIMPEAPVSHEPLFMPEPAPAPEIPKPAAVVFPAMPEDKPAAPDIAGGKVCTCCGMSNLQDAEFCASCGVDFD